MTSLDDAAKCALVSIDSILRSNGSVGLPLDMLVYEKDSLAVTRFVSIDEHNQYFQRLRSNWGQQRKSVFEGIDAPVWDAAPSATGNVLPRAAMHSQPMRVSLPLGLPAGVAPAAMQSLAGQAETKTQQQATNPILGAYRTPLSPAAAATRSPHRAGSVDASAA